jgi:hypothetical protein
MIECSSSFFDIISPKTYTLKPYDANLSFQCSFVSYLRVLVTTLYHLRRIRFL